MTYYQTQMRDSGSGGSADSGTADLMGEAAALNGSRGSSLHRSRQSTATNNSPQTVREIDYKLERMREFNYELVSTMQVYIYFKIIIKYTIRSFYGIILLNCLECT